MKYLFIGAHTDDIELNCGGWIAKLKATGHEVNCIAFSNCDNPKLSEEMRNSMMCLGVSSHKILSYPVRKFSDYRQRILDELILSAKDYEYIITHSPDDLHQDHAVIGQESTRAFRVQNLLTYQHVFNRGNLLGAYVVDISGHVETKQIAINKYQSQLHREYTSEDYIEALARISATGTGLRYAERFTPIRLKC